MTFYVGNAFSLGMLDTLVDGPVFPVITLVSEEAAREFAKLSFVSCVGHADTAGLFTNILGVPIEMRRVSTSLNRGDSILVGQYNGPRLPEGAKIRWILVNILL